MPKNHEPLAALMPRNPDPAEEHYALTLPTGEPEMAAADLRARLEVLRRQAPKIALLVIACVLVAGIYVLRLPKLYDATAVLRVDPSAQQNVVGQDQTQPTLDNTALMATELDEIKSAAVVIPVIRSLNLAAEPSLNPSGEKAAAPGFVADGVSEALLRNVLNGLTVTRPPNTLLLDITYRASSPQLAAAIANAVAAAMIKHEYDTRAESLRASSEYLTAQVQDLRARMEKSELALTAFERTNEILSPDDKFSLLNQRLSSVATDLDKQRETDRHLQAELSLAQGHKLDAILVSGRGQALTPLVDALHGEQLAFAGIAAKYGPADPAYKEAQRRLAGYQNAINAAMDHIANQIQAEATAQDDQTRLTQAAYDEQKTALQNFNSNNAQYSLLKQQADSETKLYQDMLQRIQEADVAAGYHSNSLRVVGPALPSRRAAYPSVLLSLLIVGLFSLAIGVAWAFAADSMDRTLTDPRSVLLGTGERLLGSLPYEAKLARLRMLWENAPEAGNAGKALAHTDSYSEAVLTLRTSLFLGAGTPLRSVAFSSAQPQDGKTTTAISMAAASARNGVTTVLVDADIRRPTVHRALGLSNRFGLTSVFQKKAGLDDVILATRLTNLWVVPAGPAVTDGTEMLHANIGAMVEELKSRFQLVFVDCPPALGFADSMIIGPTVDAVVMVARAASTPREFVRAAIEQLHAVRANVVGVVLNGVSAKTNQYYRYYRNYSRYYSSDEEPDSASSAAG